MLLEVGPAWAKLRPWLILGRVSNLPTVWSNCLAAWLLGDGGPGGRLATLLAGASCVYLGGMFLNDACDVEFDRRHRPERPIPAGQVGVLTVGLAGLAALVVGWGLLASLGKAPAWLGLLLVASVVVYDFSHKLVAFSPVNMALCRHLLFLVAGSAAWAGVVGETMWSGLVLGSYIIGLSHVAREESTHGVQRWWPLGFLAAPLPLALCMNAPEAWEQSAVLLPLLIWLAWTVLAVRPILRREADAPRRAVSALLAGIVLVDMLAVMPTPWWGGVFLVLFALARLLQRVVPAT